MSKIPFNRPFTVGLEFEYIRQAIEAGHLSGGGAFARKCQQWLETRLGIPRALLTPSCTHALEMAALLLEVGPGDEVIVPSFTFVSTVNAFLLRGAKPVFCDVRPDTLNLDEKRLPELVTRRTKAIVPVHYAGVGCEMDDILRVARAAGVAVVEDNAHGLLGKYRGRWLGTLGDMATLSFHETKNLVCGEGGALLCSDGRFVDRAEILQEKGTDRSRFFRGQVDKYTWRDVGSSWVQSEILAAFLFTQFEAAESIQSARRQVWERYYRELGVWAGEQGIRLPVVPDHCESSHHAFTLLLPDLASRDRFIAHMKERDVQCTFHYLPLHLSPMGRKLGGREGQCPVTEEVSDRLVRLPLYAGLTPDLQTRVLDAIRSFRVQAARLRRAG